MRRPAIGVGHGELRIEGDGAIEVDDGAVVLARMFIEGATIVVGHRIVWLDLDGAAVVRERVILIVHALIDRSAIEKKDSVVGIEL